MSDTIKHRHQTAIAPTGADVDNNEWNDSHVFAGGIDGQVVTRNSGAADGWSWSTGGKILQVLNFKTGALATGGTVIPLDNTIPQITEGDQYMSLTITPLNALNSLMIDVWCFLTSNATNWLTAALFQDAGANALAASVNFQQTATAACPVSFRHFMLAGTTLATTFKVRAGRDASAGTTVTFNGSGGTQLFNGVMASSITITELAA